MTITEPLASDYSPLDRLLYRALQRRIPVGLFAALIMGQLVGAICRQLFHRMGFGMILVVEIPACALAGYLIAQAQIEWQRRHNLGPCLKDFAGNGGCARPGRWALHIRHPAGWSDDGDLPPQTGCWCDRHAPAVLAEWAALPGAEALTELRLVIFVDRHRERSHRS